MEEAYCALRSIAAIACEPKSDAPGCKATGGKLNLSAASGPRGRKEIDPVSLYATAVDFHAAQSAAWSDFSPRDAAAI
jgi:hypothetical protein